MVLNIESLVRKAHAELLHACHVSKRVNLCFAVVVQQKASLSAYIGPMLVH